MLQIQTNFLDQEQKVTDGNRKSVSETDNLIDFQL